MSWLKRIFRKPSRAEALKRIAEGVMHARRGQPALALACYDEAIRLDPDTSVGYLNRGLALQDLFNAGSAEWTPAVRGEKLEEIAESLESALERDASQVVAWRSLGHVSVRLGRYIRAEEAFVQVLDRAPEDFPHREEALREQRRIAGRAERERAIAYAVELVLDGAASLGDLREAQERLRPLLILPDVPSDAFWAAGVLAKRLADATLAREMFEACIDRDERHVFARRELATLCMVEGEGELALVHSQVAFEEQPENPAVVCNVGVCHLSLGDLDQAAEYLEMARAMAPGDPIIQKAWDALQQARAAPGPR